MGTRGAPRHQRLPSSISRLHRKLRFEHIDRQEPSEALGPTFENSLPTRSGSGVQVGSKWSDRPTSSPN